MPSRFKPMSRSSNFPSGPDGEGLGGGGGRKGGGGGGRGAGDPRGTA